MPKSKRRLGLAIGLFFLAPLVAEFLLGNLPITMLGALVVLAPLYGGGALLIRESVRRAGPRWLLWSMRHKLALAAGAALAYGWHSFVETPAVAQTASLVRVGNAIFVAAAVALIAAAAARNRRSKPASIPEWEAS